MHDRKEAGRGPRIAAALIGAAMLAGLTACEPGTDRAPAEEPGRDVRPDPELGAQRRGADIGVAGQIADREGDPARNEPDADPDDRERSASSAEDSTRIAALPSSPVRAHAAIEPTEGHDARGEASFVETDDGLDIVVTMTGLPPGLHGIHVHEHGDCSGPAAEAAGDHFNPEGTPHGAPSDDPSKRHAGDLGNLFADDDGRAELMLTMSDLSIAAGRGVAGRAIVVHSAEDDFTTQPSGDSGDRVACGVIEARAAG